MSPFSNSIRSCTVVSTRSFVPLTPTVQRDLLQAIHAIQSQLDILHIHHLYPSRRSLSLTPPRELLTAVQREVQRLHRLEVSQSRTLHFAARKQRVHAQLQRLQIRQLCSSRPSIAPTLQHHLLRVIERVVPDFDGFQRHQLPQLQRFARYERVRAILVAVLRPRRADRELVEPREVAQRALREVCERSVPDRDFLQRGALGHFEDFRRFPNRVLQHDRVLRVAATARREAVLAHVDRPQLRHSLHLEQRAVRRHAVPDHDPKQPRERAHAELLHRGNRAASHQQSLVHVRLHHVLRFLHHEALPSGLRQARRNLSRLRRGDGFGDELRRRVEKNRRVGDFPEGGRLVGVGNVVENARKARICRERGRERDALRVEIDEVVHQGEVAEVEALVLSFVLPDQPADVVQGLRVNAEPRGNRARLVDELVEPVEIVEMHVVAVRSDVLKEQKRPLHFLHRQHRHDAPQRARKNRGGKRRARPAALRSRSGGKRRRHAGGFGGKRRFPAHRSEFPRDGRDPRGTSERRGVAGRGGEDFAATAAAQRRTRRRPEKIRGISGPQNRGTARGGG